MQHLGSSQGIYIIQVAMPARQAITKERLEEVAAAAVQTALQDVLRKTGACCDAGLRCTYCGPADSDVTEMTGRTNLLFQWQLSWEGVNIYAEKQTRSDKAMYSGLLAPPRSWSHMLMALSLPRAINQVGGFQWMRDGTAAIECTGLAMARPMAEPQESLILVRGGARVQHLVLARTGGYLLCSTSLVPSLGGIVKVSPEQVWRDDARKRLRGRIQWRGLEELAKKQPQSYATTVAVAHLMDAEERGVLEGEVQKRLLTNPLQWNLTSSTHLFLLWRVKVGARWRPHARVMSLSSLLKGLHEL